MVVERKVMTMKNGTMARPAGPQPVVRLRARPQGVLGVKMLISSLALVATLLGWVRLTTVDQDAAGKLALQPKARQIITPLAPRPTAAYRLAPLPTLVPLTAAEAAPAQGALAAPVVARPVPTSAVPDVTQLRAVSVPAPAAPIVVTRSSR